ncbi:hypothetical protein PV387_06170 [Streptomyces sp. ME02-6987-2C]|uniref:hypothetical protein n=1 Tax=Streptomyces TaxID=1883 RepID=UPI0029B957F0|nr:MULTISPECIES: hypothetical protein [Streptomyces]MDX3365617.1 hypothetical protein [Streptomyces sp. ME02-6987-2C]MDX3425184.1 hypothetical protein [Streptomyces sp. ME02-6985-2c]
MKEEPARPAAPAAPTPPEEPQTAADPAPPPADAPAPDEGAGRRRRRGRTALLIATAAVLGLVAGTCTGVLVQAGREPTKLPPLSQAALARGEEKAPKPLSAGQDRRVRTDGDLRDLLLKKPRGAQEADWLEGSDGWMDLTGYASTFLDLENGFENLLDNEFRRAVVTGWEVEGAYTVEIRLIQYRQEEVLAASQASEGGQYYAGGDGTEDWAIPGTGEGRVFVDEQPAAGLESAAFPYRAEAHASRGDIAMEIWVSGAERIDKKTVIDVAERQMERL